MEQTTNLRLALIGIIVTDHAQTARLNEILSSYQEYVIGRMGLPHQRDDTALISVAVEASADVINSLTGKLGKLPGISAKAVFAKQ